MISFSKNYLDWPLQGMKEPEIQSAFRLRGIRTFQLAWQLPPVPETKSGRNHFLCSENPYPKTFKAGIERQDKIEQTMKVSAELSSNWSKMALATKSLKHPKSPVYRAYEDL